MQESCTYGSVRGAPSNGRPYRNRQIGQRFQGFVRDGAERPKRGGVIEHLPASTERPICRWKLTSGRSPPNEAVPPGPRRVNVKPQLLFERLRVELHEIGATALERKIGYAAGEYTQNLLG
jgi:hypothetical protein